MANLAGAQQAAEQPKRHGEGAFGDYRAPAPSRMRLPTRGGENPVRKVRPAAVLHFLLFTLVPVIAVVVRYLMPDAEMETRAFIVILAVLMLLAIWLFVRALSRD
jgi:hypothetical protein